jgi:hypothetical protein
VKGLFHQCGADLDPAQAEILNMRTMTSDEVNARIAAGDLLPNVPVKGGASGAAQ